MLDSFLSKLEKLVRPERPNRTARILLIIASVLYGITALVSLYAAISSVSAGIALNAVRAVLYLICTLGIIMVVRLLSSRPFTPASKRLRVILLVNACAELTCGLLSFADTAQDASSALMSAISAMLAALMYAALAIMLGVSSPSTPRTYIVPDADIDPQSQHSGIPTGRSCYRMTPVGAVTMSLVAAQCVCSIISTMITTIKEDGTLLAWIGQAILSMLLALLMYYPWYLVICAGQYADAPRMTAAERAAHRKHTRSEQKAANERARTMPTGARKLRNERRWR